jgi:hypothetical protein
MTTAEVISQTPAWIAALIHGVDYLFPDMTGGDFSLALAHGIAIEISEVAWFCTAQIGYSMMLFAAGLVLFGRRDL